MASDLKTLLANPVKTRLAAGEVVLSMLVRLVRSIEIAQIAKTAGYDAINIDLEHGAFTLDTASQICIAAGRIGVAPLVRVPTYEREFVSRILDNGAMGIIAPHVESAADARTVVANSKFPPFGHRSVSSMIPQLDFQSFPAAEARQALNEATTIVAMIESPKALERIDEIAAVEGVDILLIGTSDLTADLGIPGQFEHDMVRQAYTDVIAAARRHGKHVGIGGLSAHPHLTADFVKLGARYVSPAIDLALLLSAAGDRSRQIRTLIA